MDNFWEGRPRSPLSALWIDPSDDVTHPARTLPQAISSCSANLNAVLYQTSGPGPHPTALLLHGLPGNEQNLDCAQSLRRSGCNVLTIHYRGSWGSPGVFTIANCLSDAAAALEWLRPANGRELRIDRQRLVVVGHGMGGFVAAHLAWSLPSYASRLAGRPLLIATADDGFGPGGDLFADAVLAFNGENLTRVHFATDHSYSTCRIELQSRLLLRLDTALGRSSACANGSTDLMI
jgi:pimeloyl-ACP methyl ester carboxylesterase